MKVHINDISSVSHMTYHNGEPCDLYTCTISCTLVGFGCGVRRRYIVVYGKSETSLERQIAKYRTEENIDVPDRLLIDKRGRHG